MNGQCKGNTDDNQGCALVYPRFVCSSQASQQSTKTSETTNDPHLWDTQTTAQTLSLASSKHLSISTTKWRLRTPLHSPSTSSVSRVTSCRDVSSRVSLQRATRKICEIKTLSRSCLVISFFIFAIGEVIIIKELLRSYSERPCLFTWMLYY